MKPARKLIVVMSDSHGGFMAGLLNPETELYNEDENGKLAPYKPTLTHTQNYLWDQYTKSLAEFEHIAGKDKIIFLHTGDLTHGNKHPDTLVSNRVSDQILIGKSNLDPIYRLKNLQAARVILGTAAHNFGLGSAELVISKHLEELHPKHDTKAMYHDHMTIDGCITDVAHHGPYPGSRVWLDGNVARFYLRDLIFREAMDGKQPPSMVLRGHYHRYILESIRHKKEWHYLTVMPAMCFLGDYTHQAARSPDRVTTGLLAYEIINGKVGEIYDHMIETNDIRTKEIL